jgi:arylformamidase
MLDLVPLRSNPREPVGAEMLAAAEARAGLEVTRDDIVLLRCWEGEWGTEGFFRALGIDASGGDWLLKRGIRSVGIDLPNLEGAIEPPFPAHEALLRPGVEVPIVENLVGLERLPARGFEFVGLPLKVRGATGSPIRAVGIVED